MARYRKIDVRIRADAKFRRLSAPQPNGQSLWFHLLTGQHTGAVPGLSSIGEAAMAEDLGWPLEGFREAFREVFREGMAKADWKARVVWVPNVIKYDPPQSPNVVKSWRTAWDEMPECALKLEAWHVLRAFLEGKGKAFLEAFLEACPKPLANPEPEPDPEQDLDPPLTPPLAQGGGAARKTKRAKIEPPPELNVLADEIERHTGIRYPPSAFEGLRERLREHSLEDLLAYIRWAARDDWLRTTVQLKPSVLLRKARCAEGVAAARAAPLLPMRRPFGGLPPEPPPPALAPGTQLPVLCDRCGERIPSTWDGERWLIPDHEWDGAPCVAPEIERRAAAGAEECV